MQTQQEIQLAYQQLVESEGKKPSSFESFLSQPEVASVDVEAYYSSFARIERDILLRTFTEVLGRLESAPEYPEFSAREKVLALYFTWLEELAKIRDFLQIIDRYELPTPFSPSYLKEMEGPFLQVIEGILEEGRATGEVAARQLLASNYPKVFWIDTRFLLHYWLKDESEAFEKTDAAVEKAVNFTFDLLAPNLLDSGFDLITFLIGK
jgi:hypothetical protein